MFKRMLIVCAVLSGLLMVSVVRVFASTTVLWDFTSSSYGCSIPSAAGTATYGFGSFDGTGLHSSTTPNGSDNYFAAASCPLSLTDITAVRIHTTASVELSEIAFSLDGNATSHNNLGLNHPSLYGTDGTGYYMEWNSADVYGLNPDGEDATSFDLYSSLAHASYSINWIEFTIGNSGGLGVGLTKPIAEAQLHSQWGIYDLQSVIDSDPADQIDSTYPNTVYAFSNTAEADVEAVAAGQVINITPYTGKDCSGALVVLQSLRRCRVFVPQYISQEVEKELVFDVELPNAYVVTVEDADDPTINYRYWLAAPVVSIGDNVVAGCILGRTIQLKNPTNQEIDGWSFGIGAALSESGEAGLSASFGVGVKFRSLLLDLGVTTVTAIDTTTGDPLRLYPVLTEEPNKENCKASTLTNCTVDNPQLKSESGVWPEGWGTGQSTVIPGGGVHLQQGGSITQADVVIDPAISYTLSVMARVTTPIESIYPLTLKIGSLTTTKNVTEGDYQLLIWTVGPREVSVTDVGVINQVDSFNSEFPVEVDIKYICLSPATATVTPGACVFANHQFDADSTGWNVVSNTTFANGQAFMGDGGIINQDNVTALPNLDESPLDYRITALVRLNASGSYTGQVGKSVELLYEFPGGAGFAEVGTIDATTVDNEGKFVFDGSVNMEHTYALTTDFTVSIPLYDTFSFGVLVTDTDGYLKGLRVDSLCLTPLTEDGSFPNPDQGGPFQPPNTAACAVVPTPIDNNVSSWTYYHWKNLERFFNCTLMIKINAIQQTVQEAWKTTRLFWRWVVVLVNRIGDWVGSVFYWLNGSIRNIAIGQVTTIYQSDSGTCSDLFCVLQAAINGLLGPLNNVINTLLGLLTTAVNLLASIIAGVIQIIVALIASLFNFLQVGQSLLISLINAYNNATPVSVPGLPTCNIDPRSSSLCMGIWVLDNTIFSGTGSAIIPALVAVFSIHLIIWVIAEIKQTITSIGASA